VICANADTDSASALAPVNNTYIVFFIFCFSSFVFSTFFWFRFWFLLDLFFPIVYHRPSSFFPSGCALLFHSFHLDISFAFTTAAGSSSIRASPQ
jgi:hypothetical protein